MKEWKGHQYLGVHPEAASVVIPLHPRAWAEALREPVSVEAALLKLNACAMENQYLPETKKGRFKRVLRKIAAFLWRHPAFVRFLGRAAKVKEIKDWQGPSP